MTPPLSDQAAEYAADAAAAARGITPLDVMLKRAFMAGALCALEQIIQNERTPRDLLAECVAFGKTIGTAAEVAR